MSCSDLPLIAIVGASGTGKRRLMSALANLDSSSDQHGALQAEATITTKYYTARVKYVVLDLDAEGTVSAEAATCLKEASAVVLLWDLTRPESFDSVRRVGKVLGCGEEEEEEECGDGPERVQICVAVEPQHHGNVSELDACEDEARSWCAGAGFEHLRCPLGDADLDSVRRGCQGGGSLLGVDCDGTALRVREALECQPWPNLEREFAGGRRATDVQPSAADVQESPAVPMVIVAGAKGLGKRRLVQALAVGPVGERADGAACAEAELRTKYYHARLRFLIVDTPARGSALGAGAEGFLLLWDAAREETFASAREFYELSARPTEDGDGLATISAGVRLCVAVGQAPGLDPSVEECYQAWCLQHSFEALRCSALDDAALEALSRDWRSGSSGKPLLAPDSEDATARIVEALQCHTWPGSAAKPTLPTAGEQMAAATKGEAPVVDAAGAPADTAACDRPGREAVDHMEQLVEEMRKVRGIEDEHERRKRACDVAMQLAASLGIDESDDEDL